MNKKRVSFIFNKTLLKIYLKNWNLTGTEMPTDLIHEDLRLLVFMIVTLELKSTIRQISRFSIEKINLNFLIDNLVEYLLLSCKYKILRILSLRSIVELKSSNQWLLKKIQIEESNTISTIIRLVHSIDLLHQSSVNLIVARTENLIVKLTDYMVYELYYTRQFSQTSYLKQYSVDYLVFCQDLKNLKTYSYWKFYIKNIYSNIKRFSTISYSLLVCTKSGLEVKQTYRNELQVRSKNSNLKSLIFDFLGFLEYLKVRVSVEL